MLTACDQPVWKSDDRVRQLMFFACLDRIPKGPQVTRYNDWSEVVNDCENVAIRAASYDAAHEDPPTVYFTPSRRDSGSVEVAK